MLTLLIVSASLTHPSVPIDVSYESIDPEVHRQPSVIDHGMPLFNRQLTANNRTVYPMSILNDFKKICGLF